MIVTPKEIDDLIENMKDGSSKSNKLCSVGAILIARKNKFIINKRSAGLRAGKTSKNK